MKNSVDKESDEWYYYQVAASDNKTKQQTNPVNKRIWVDKMIKKIVGFVSMKHERQLKDHYEHW